MKSTPQLILIRRPSHRANVVVVLGSVASVREIGKFCSLFVEIEKSLVLKYIFVDFKSLRVRNNLNKPSSLHHHLENDATPKHPKMPAVLGGHSI